ECVVSDRDRDVEDPGAHVAMLADDGVVAIASAVNMAGIELRTVAPVDRGMEVLGRRIRLAEVRYVAVIRLEHLRLNLQPARLEASDRWREWRDRSPGHVEHGRTDDAVERGTDRGSPRGQCGRQTLRARRVGDRGDRGVGGGPSDLAGDVLGRPV